MGSEYNGKHSYVDVDDKLHKTCSVTYVSLFFTNSGEKNSSNTEFVVQLFEKKFPVNLS